MNSIRFRRLSYRCLVAIAIGLCLAASAGPSRAADGESPGGAGAAPDPGARQNPTRAYAPREYSTEELKSLDVTELAEQVSNATRRIEELQQGVEILTVTLANAPRARGSIKASLDSLKTTIEGVVDSDCSTPDGQTAVDEATLAASDHFIEYGSYEMSFDEDNRYSAPMSVSTLDVAIRRVNRKIVGLRRHTGPVEAPAVCALQVSRVKALAADVGVATTAVDSTTEDSFLREELANTQEQLRTERNNKTRLLEELRNRPSAGVAIDKLPLVVIFLGVFSLAIMVMVQRFSPQIQRRWVDSGQVIQFMTVTVLIIVVLVLGLAGTLKGETVGTLIGAIGGYVLSAGIGRALEARARDRETAREEARRPPGSLAVARVQGAVPDPGIAANADAKEPAPEKPSDQPGQKEPG